MDPRAALERLLKALRDRDGEEACAAAEDLIEWLDRGGFEPDELVACVNFHDEHGDALHYKPDMAFSSLLGSLIDVGDGIRDADKACEAAEELIELVDHDWEPPSTLEGCLDLVAGRRPKRPKDRQLRKGRTPRARPPGVRAVTNPTKRKGRARLKADAHQQRAARATRKAIKAVMGEFVSDATINRSVKAGDGGHRAAATISKEDGLPRDHSPALIDLWEEVNDKLAGDDLVIEHINASIAGVYDAD